MLHGKKHSCVSQFKTLHKQDHITLITVYELQSELEVKSKDMDTMRISMFSQKRKYDQRENDSAMLSKPIELDSLEHEVSIITIHIYNCLKLLNSNICRL